MSTKIVTSTNYKKCKSCLIEKDLSEFSRDKYAKGGYTSKCRICRGLSNKKWREDNRVYVNKKAIDNYYANQQRYIEYSRKYKELNSEKVKRRYKIYIKEYNQREYVKMKYRISGSQRRRVIRERSDGTITLDSLTTLLELQHNLCNICGINIDGLRDNNGNDGRHLDHVIPLAKEGVHSINNVQWLCWKCNLSKGDRKI